MKQRLLRNRPGSALRHLATSCAKDYKAHSLQQTGFAESPNTHSWHTEEISFMTTGLVGSEMCIRDRARSQDVRIEHSIANFLLYDAQKTHLFPRTRDFLVSLKTMQTRFFPTSFTLPMQFLQTQQKWHLYCFAILGWTSIVIHKVKQRLLRNRPGSGSWDQSFTKHYEGNSLVRTASMNCPIVTLI